ncbi:glycosyltransferase [Luteolibacter sp. SL250]|uniref:glycosyltransferase family 2 protein n=1 Tax=Luteolibacter sp. SL250 TaxID=2995170 RepID=UPI002270DFBB|nr:glycosyltransferase [Luteolibacter sp. SL250]WAC19622.1 glycosyltransferase [Luteolibacter sp. SL250]
MLSVVVPVYNVEKYLRRCLDSIFSQGPDVGFEVIAVNDASTDGSRAILEEYAERYENLLIIDQEVNSSLAVARKTGIGRAKGFYVIHVDSDDWVNPGMFSELLQLAEKEGHPDVVVFNDIRSDGVRILTELKIKEFSRAGADGKDAIQHLFFGACVNKMVKRELLGDLVYGSVYQNLAEDLIYSTEVLVKASSFVLTPSTYYNYFWNEDSLSVLMTPERYVKSRTELFRLLISIKERYPGFNPDWLVNIRDRKMDADTLRYLTIHHLTKDKVSASVFGEFDETYNHLFGSHRDALDVRRLYRDRLYLMRVLAKNVGWLNVLKKIIRSRVAA